MKKVVVWGMFWPPNERPHECSLDKNAFDTRGGVSCGACEVKPVDDVYVAMHHPDLAEAAARLCTMRAAQARLDAARKVLEMVNKERAVVHWSMTVDGTDEQHCDGGCHGAG